MILTVTDAQLEMRIPLEARTFLDSPHLEITKVLLAIRPEAPSPSDIKLISGDQLFDYRLTARLFHGLASIIVNPDSINLSFKGITSYSDIKVLDDVVQPIFEILSTRMSTINVELQLNAKSDTDTNIDTYFKSLAPKNFQHGGTIAWRRREDVIERFLFERNVTEEDSAFANVFIVGLPSASTESIRSIWTAHASALFADQDIAIDFQD